MPLTLLQTLTAQSLPVTITDKAAVDELRELRAAGLVAVMLSPPQCPTPFCRVLAITHEGRAAIAALQTAETPASKP